MARFSADYTDSETDGEYLERVYEYFLLTRFPPQGQKFNPGNQRRAFRVRSHSCQTRHEELKNRVAEVERLLQKIRDAEDTRIPHQKPRSWFETFLSLIALISLLLRLA